MSQRTGFRLSALRLSVSRLAALGVVTCMALCATAWAQKDAGSIVGTVKDQTGAIVAKAQVTVTDLDRGNRTETVTNDSGAYVGTC